MRQLQLIVSIGAILTSSLLFAQQPLVLALPDTTAKSGDTLRLDITTRAFVGIVSLQFSLRWDTSVLQYVRFTETDLPSIAVGSTAAASGILRINWRDPELMGQTLADGSSIVRFTFFVKGETGSSTALTFANTPLAIQVFRFKEPGRFEALPMSSQNGRVVVGATVPFQANFTITGPRCAGDSTGAINATFLNTPPGATIRWTGPNNFQSEQEDLTSLVAGAYRLQIVDDQSTVFDSILTIPQPTSLRIGTLAPVQASCLQPVGSVTATGTGGTSPYQYSIGSDFSTNNQFTNLAPGLYTLTVRDANGCLAADTFRIRQIDAPQLNLVDTISLCNGQSTLLDAGEHTSYRWSTGAVTRTITISNAGTYRLTVTNAMGCTASDSVRVFTSLATPPPLPDSLLLCDGQRATLDAGSFQNYTWSNGATTRTITIANAGIYRVTVTNTTGCTAADSTRVVTGTAPALLLADTLSICNGQNATLDAGVAGSYRWSTGATTRSISVGSPNVYRVTVTGASGCAAVDSTLVLVSAPPVLTLPDSVAFCTGQNITLEAGTHRSYRWSNGATAPSITVSNSGTYTLTVTNAIGCSTADSTRVIVYTPPLITLPVAVTLCANQDTILDAGLHDSYFWSTGAATRTIRVANAGLYSVTVSNTNGCTATDSVQVQSAIAPQVELGDTILLCAGENELLYAGEHARYRWSTGDITRSITVSTTGNYSVTVSNAAGCTASDTIRVQTITRFEAKIENDTLTICPGGSLELRASLADTYQWIDTSGTLSARNVRNPVARPRATSAYTLIAGSSCGADTVTVTVQVAPSAATAGPDTTITRGETLQLYASGGVAYFWFLTNYPVNNALIPNPIIQPEDTTAYFVMITDGNGCKILDTVNVFVAEDQVEILAVNLITPNGDGKNDVLEFKGLEKNGANSLRVYNRWGDLVYEKINYQNDDDRFDGTRNGKPLPAGNYYYVLSFKEIDIKQTLTILRE